MKLTIEKLMFSYSWTFPISKCQTCNNSDWHHLHISPFPWLQVHFSLRCLLPSSRSTMARQFWTLSSRNSFEFSTEPCFNWIAVGSKLRLCVPTTPAQFARQHKKVKNNFFFFKSFLIFRVLYFLPHSRVCSLAVPTWNWRETATYLGRKSLWRIWKTENFLKATMYVVAVNPNETTT